MRLRTRVDLWGAALLSSLSTMQVGCGGATADTAAGGGGAGGTGGQTVGTGGQTVSTGGQTVSTGGQTVSTGGQTVGTGGQTVGTGGSLQATGGSSGGFTQTGGTASVNPFACKNPTPLVSTAVTGYERCSDGHVHRSAKLECPSTLPRSTTHVAIAGDLCATDADCTTKPHGYCSTPPNLGAGPISYSCSYGCRVDSDCATSEICVCGPTIGACVRSACTSDADCGGDLECATYQVTPTDVLCSTQAPPFACQTPADTCGGPVDCPRPPAGWSDCVLASGSRSCSSIASCAVAGRPFLVDGSERLAQLAERSDWLDATLTPSVAGLDHDLRETLAERWARIGCMEHASVAAFARFALQLLSLGAPAELVEQAAVALADETRHARACFALASHYAGRSIGPGPLVIEGSLAATSLEEILVLTVREGCFGETLAAIETLEASKHARDPVVRGLLQRISADETRHAQLAWRFVAWALAKLGPEAPERARVAAELERGQRPLAAVSDSALDAESQRLLSHGIIPERVSAALRSTVQEEVVRPCAFGLGLLHNHSKLGTRAA